MVKQQMTGLGVALALTPGAASALAQPPAGGGAGGAQADPPQGPPPTHADLDYAPPEPATSNGHKLDLYIPAGVDRARCRS